MKGKAIIPLVLGLAVGLIAVKFTVDFVNEARGSAPKTQTVDVVRAKLDIGTHVKITAEMVEIVKAPKGGLVPLTGTFSTFKDVLDEQGAVTILGVVGRVTAKGIPASTLVLEPMLAPPGTLAGMVGRIPPGYRAVSVKIDEVTGVAYQIKAGDWVDVIVVMDIEARGRRNNRETIAEVVLQNVQVAALGRDMASQQTGPAAKTKPAKSATLLVTEMDVPKLHLAATRGKITLSMRGRNDDATGEAVVVRGSDVFKSYRRDKEPQPTPKQVVQIAPPAPDPVEPHSVVVHKGSTLPSVSPITERVTFENEHSSRIISVRDGAAAGSVTMIQGRRTADSRSPRRSDGASNGSDSEENGPSPEGGE